MRRINAGGANDVACYTPVFGYWSNLCLRILCMALASQIPSLLIFTPEHMRAYLGRKKREQTDPLHDPQRSEEHT